MSSLAALNALLSRPGDVDRFWEKVRKGHSDECWPWTDSPTSTGYGRFVVRYEMRTYHLKGSRVAWVLGNGTALPEGLIVRHSCDNTICCNPKHLLIGTYKDNTADAIARGRWVPPPVHSGELHPRARLTDDQVRELRTSSDPGAVLAARYSISLGEVYNMRSRQSRRNAC